MPFISKEKLSDLQKNSNNIRNVCILAHVDHGKTTLADSLIATNEIISPKMAGTLRYLDSRSDEQERGITMKSSCITLFYATDPVNQYLINLVDSPGHVDFFSEVSAALKICDGSILLVDVVEGVCSQTRSCLHQIYKEKLTPILVLNKIDRLILEKKFTPLDAYVQITQVLEQVNAVVAGIFVCGVVSKDLESDNVEFNLDLDSDLYFCPIKGNVVFSSAVDGWGFSLKTFAKIYEERINKSAVYLETVLWGDFYYDKKKNDFRDGAQNNAKMPTFVTFILEKIWFLYETSLIRKDKEKILDIVTKMNIHVPQRELRQTDPRAQIKSVLSRWLPIDQTLLDIIICSVPSPNHIENDRVEKFFCLSQSDFHSYSDETKMLKEELKMCDPNSPNIIAFVSKMFPPSESHVPKIRFVPLTSEQIEERRILLRSRLKDEPKISEARESLAELSVENDEKQTLIAFARVFSGTVKTGMKIFVLSPKYDPRDQSLSNSSHIKEAEIKELFILMGGDLQPVDQVPAGNILGIGGLEQYIVKTATLSTSIHCPPFNELDLAATAVLSVALEAQNHADMPKLIKGLKLLNQADACVNISIHETGEHVISTLGEVHLEKCVRDLEEQYAKTKLNISKPIVSFKETIISDYDDDMLMEKLIQIDKTFADKIVTIQTPNKLGIIRLIAIPILKNTLGVLEKHSTVLKILSNPNKLKNISEKYLDNLTAVKNSLKEAFGPSQISIDKIWSITSSKHGINMLINLSDYCHPNIWVIENNNERVENNKHDPRRDFNSSFVSGFQLATVSGPLCEEPLHGVCFIICSWEIQPADDATSSSAFGPFSGQILSTVKEGCRQVFQLNKQRLICPMYSCNIVVSGDVLGKMYAVIGRRHGKVISSDVVHGTGDFMVQAHLPVIESFNFAQEIRKQTSGLACPQLIFSHWEIIHIDPFWVPTTEEEYEHFGEKSDTGNRAKDYIDEVRTRKGLFTEKKIIMHAEKQRTLSKNK